MLQIFDLFHPRILGFYKANIFIRKKLQSEITIIKNYNFSNRILAIINTNTIQFKTKFKKIIIPNIYMYTHINVNLVNQ